MTDIGMPVRIYEVEMPARKEEPLRIPEPVPATPERERETVPA